MKVPVIDDTAQLATILAENSTVGSTTDPVLPQVSLGAFCHVAPAVLAPWSWLQDTAGLYVLQVLANIAGDRIGRAVDAHLAVCTGSGQPLGISAATVGVTTTSNAAITDVQVGGLLLLRARWLLWPERSLGDALEHV